MDTDPSKTWGLEVIGGVKRYARHVVFVGGKGEKINARLVYDYRKQWFLCSTIVLTII